MASLKQVCFVPIKESSETSMAAWENVELRKVWQTFTSSKQIGHFRVPKRSLSKQSQGKNLSCENEFYLHDYRTIRRLKTGSWRETVFGGKLSRLPTPFNRSNKENNFYIKGFAVTQVLNLRHKVTTKKAAYFK